MKHSCVKKKGGKKKEKEKRWPPYLVLATRKIKSQEQKFHRNKIRSSNTSCLLRLLRKILPSVVSIPTVTQLPDV